jgi:chromosomal replication initiator protein
VIVVNGVFTIPLSRQPAASASAASRPGARSGGLTQFIAGPENRLLGAALKPLLESADGRFEPLSIYGPPGCGKTHLARGLAVWWAKKYPSQSVVCLAGSELAEQFAGACDSGRLDSWRTECRQADLLIVEDLGQLATKRPAQQELIAMLDSARDREAITIVTARSLPSRLSGLLPTLRSRLSAGLAIPLCLPGRDARLAILERLAGARGLNLNRRVLQTLADGLSLSVPGLSGVLMQLEVQAKEDGRQIEATDADRFISRFNHSEPPTMRMIGAATAKHFGLTIGELKSSGRRHGLIVARAVAVYLARQHTSLSLNEIGDYFGGRDHTTVLNAFHKALELLKDDVDMRQAVADLKKALTQR